MTRIRVFVLLALALSGVLCDVSKTKDSKRAVKPTEFKKIEKKSTHEKRDSSELTAIYNIKPKEEPFRPLYQYHYPGVPLRGTRYIAAAATPQISYSKPDAAIGIGGGGHSPVNAPEGGSGNTGGIQYASQSSYKPEGGIHYAPSSYKQPGSNSLGVIQYASSAYRGPFITTYQQQPAGLVKVHPAPVYAPAPPPPPPAAQQPAAVTLPLHYGGFEQQLPPQHHQQNQYAIAFPADYVRHYQQNLASPYPLHAAHTVPMVFTSPPAPQPQPLAAIKDQPFKQSTVHYISLAPQSASSAVASAPHSGPMVITHFIPFYGPGPQQHQQFQQQLPGPFYFGGHHQQKPTFAYTAFPHHQQAVQIAPKHQLIGPIQMAAIGAASAATVPIIPFKPIVAAQQLQQQQQQPLHHFHHPGATSYTRYSQSLSGAGGSGAGGGGSGVGGGAGGDSNPIEVPASETSSSSTLKLAPLYSSSSSSSSPSTSSGSIYAGATGGGSGKVSYTYASEANSVGPVYTHPGAIHYGTHLYQPTKVVEIGSNRVTAGSAAIAGVAPPAYHLQQKSAAGGGGSSSPVVKFP